MAHLPLAHRDPAEGDEWVLAVVVPQPQDFLPKRQKGRSRRVEGKARWFAVGERLMVMIERKGQRRSGTLTGLSVRSAIVEMTDGLPSAELVKLWVRVPEAGAPMIGLRCIVDGCNELKNSMIACRLDFVRKRRNLREALSLVERLKAHGSLRGLEQMNR